ncbi:MAG: hypothetical protein ACI395_03520 [Candidatus Cryptobacteroides sp.]
MKTSRIILFSAAIITAACTKEIAQENTPEVNLVPITFSVGSEQDEDTKVYLGEDLKTVLWSSDDKIKVFDRVSNELPEFEITAGEGTTSASISGSVSETASAPYFAMYPYQADAVFTTAEQTPNSKACKSGYITLNLPAEQNAVANSVDPNAFIGVAMSEDGTNFSFKNLTAFVKFKLNEADIDGLETVSFSGNSLGSVAGDMYVYFDTDGNINQTYVSGKMQSYVTLSKPDEGWNAKAVYYMAIRPLAFADGFTITAKYSDGSCKHISVSKGYYNASGTEQTISRNRAMNLGTLPALKAGLPNDLYIAYLHGQNLDADGVINKTNFLGATLTLTNSNISSKGVYFVSKGENTQTISGNFDDDIIVIGRYQSATPTLTASSQIGIRQCTNWIFYNIILDASSVTGYLIKPAYTSQANVQNFIFENCEISLPKNSPLLYWSNTDEGKDIDIDNAVLRNNKFQINVDADNKTVNILNFGNEPITPAQVIIENNLIYTTTDNYVNGKLLQLQNNGNTQDNIKVLIKNNTLVNFGGSSSVQPLVQMYQGSNQTIDFSGNLSVYTTTSTLSVRLFTFNGTLDKYSGTITYDKNKYFHPSTVTWALAGSWPKYLTEKPTEKFTSETENPFSTCDLANGNFVRKSAYASYGSSLVPVEDTTTTEE